MRSLILFLACISCSLSLQILLDSGAAGGFVILNGNTQQIISTQSTVSSSPSSSEDKYSKDDYGYLLPQQPYAICSSLHDMQCNRLNNIGHQQHNNVIGTNMGSVSYSYDNSDNNLNHIYNMKQSIDNVGINFLSQQHQSLKRIEELKILQHEAHKLRLNYNRVSHLFPFSVNQKSKFNSNSNKKNDPLNNPDSNNDENIKIEMFDVNNLDADLVKALQNSDDKTEFNDAINEIVSRILKKNIVEGEGDIESIIAETILVDENGEVISQSSLDIDPNTLENIQTLATQIASKYKEQKDNEHELSDTESSNHKSTIDPSQKRKN